MAIELFRPFVMKKLVEDGVSNNIKSAKKMVDKGQTEVWDALEVVIKEHPVLLNRAPTLHRLGIQAFEPILVEGRALKLHPLVCTAYNADFDGDQMAIHVPLSAEAQAEARILMLSANNLLHPKDGHPVTVPTHDMILGSYYLTFQRDDEPGAGKHFVSPNEALMAYQCGVVGIHAPIHVRITKEIDGVEKYKTIETTVGRIIFNEPLPQDLGFVDRNDPEQLFDYEIGFRTGKKELEKIIERCISRHGFTRSASVLDKIKTLGFKYSTQGAITISISDMTVPDTKWTLIRQTEKEVIAIEQKFKRGFITDEERYRLVVREWEKTTKDVTDALADTLSEYNPVYMMAHSGARGSMNQTRQLAGMRGLMANTAGRTIEIPIKANFREGLTVLEYFVSSRGARKGLADTALRTADSGYLTRRLVDVSQDVIVREQDCQTHDGIMAAEIVESGSLIETFGEVIHGRYPADDIVDEKTGEVLFTRDHMLINSDSVKLLERGISTVKIRTAMDCESRSGICAMCYGINLATGGTVSIGEAVGVIAAQSIGEPGTQLTMRTFHTGGVAGDDITQGLPRVEELFEARKPKKMAILSDIDGNVEIEETRKNAMISIIVTNPEDGDVRTYQTPYFSGIRVRNGDTIKAGDKLTEGALNPHDVMRILGKGATQAYLISEVQKVYRQQGVDINDKHIEVIVRQMMRKVKIEDGGDTELLAGTTIDSNDVKQANAKIKKRIEEGETELRPADASPLLMGITKASLATESFLSAASFQETTKVLTEAAIKGKVDRLIGLKENVIIGKLVPAGSGLSMYRKFDSDIEQHDGAYYSSRNYENRYDNFDEDDVDLSVLIGSGNAL